MNRSGFLSLMPLVAALALGAAQPEPSKPKGNIAATPAAPQGVEIASRLSGTVAGAGQVELRLVGTAVHTLTGRRVLFTAKQLVALDPGNFGPVTVTLDPRRQSVGTLASEKFPTEHRQSFFLLIHSERLGNLISNAPLTLTARIESSPPTATYKSVGGDVVFYKQGDPGKTPVLTVQGVTSDVKPAVSTAVDIKSRVTASVGDKRVNLQLVGTAVHLLNGRSVLFIAKRLVAVNPGDIGPLTFTLNPRRPSVGTLATETFPTEHRQSFFLLIHSERLGRLVSDDPVVVAARIESSPPTATYQFAGKPVVFYKQGDASKKPVLTIETVESDVTPPAPAVSQGVEIKSQWKGTVTGAGPVRLTLTGVAIHTLSGRSVLFTAKRLVAVDPGNLGPLTVTLNPRRKSAGTLASDSFPTEHRQNFFLQIHSEKLGTLVSEDPVTMSARIQSTPPTATYKSVGGAVRFFKEGDSGKRPVLIVQEVTSEVKPAASQAVEMKSRVKATVGDRQVSLQLAGRAQHILSGTSVIFTAKQLVAVDPGDIGPLTFTLNPERGSVGTLASPTFPTEHRQSFFLQIRSERLGTLISGEPVVVAARIERTPPTATYKLAGKPVAFYKQGDPGKKPVLTIEAVESDVTPATR